MPSSAAQREPQHARLAVRQDDEGGEERPDRGAEIAADLEYGLRQPCRPPEAMRATREDSGWKTEEPVPIIAAATRSSG